MLRPTGDLIGYLNDIRITRGVARYTTTFTPPDNIPEITPKGPRLYDQILGDCYSMGSQGPVLEETSGPFGGPSLYFNGTNYLTMPYSKYFDLFDQSTAFTIELWFKIDKDTVKVNALTRRATLIAFGMPNSGAITNGMSIGVAGSSSYTGNGIEIQHYYSDTNWFASFYPVNIEKGTWYHLAICKKSSVDLLSVYLNGNFISPSIDYFAPNFYLKNFSTTLPIKIGSTFYTNSNRSFVGWLADLRITKQCRYYGDHITPTSIYDLGDSYFADTTLMMKFNESTKNPAFGLTNDIKGHPMTVTGDVALSAGGKFGGTCAYFDGSAGGDRLEVTYASDYDISTGQFTLEFWYRVGSTITGQTLLDWRSANSSIGMSIMQSGNTTKKFIFYAGDSGTGSWEVTLTSTSTFTTIGQWIHIAVTRNSSNLFGLWINGQLEASSTWAGTIYINSAPLWLGIDRGGSATPTYGYYDNFRLTKGVCRYTTTFTPPTAAFPTDSTDEYWSSVVLLIPFDEMGQFNDVMKRHSFTPIGNVEISSDQSKFGSRSARFKGTGYLTTPHREDLNFLGDFTIEGWIRPDSITGTQIILRKPDNVTTYAYPAYEIRLSDASIQFTAYSVNTAGNQIFLNQTFGTVSLNTWHHFAIAKMGSTWKGFLDGVVGWTGTSASTHYITNQTTLPLVIGGDSVGRQYGYSGYLDDLRITKNVARYSDTFTPPTVSHLEYGVGDPAAVNYPGLHLRFNNYNGLTNFFDERGSIISITGTVSLSSAISKFGGVSAYFDGSGGYLTTPNSSAVNLSDSEFTVECWIYPTAFPAAVGHIVGKWNSTLSWQLYLYADGAIGAEYSTSGSWQVANVITSSANTLSLNTWSHVAWVRSGNTMILYHNGTSVGSVEFTGTIINPEYALSIGNNSNTQVFTGYMDDLRITKGIARYTQNFTVPTQPYPTFSNNPYASNELIHFPLSGIQNNSTPTFVDLGPGNYTLTPSNMTISNTLLKFPREGFASSFNGTSSRIAFTAGAPGNTVVNWQKDYTIEFWMYPTSVSGATRTIYSFDGTTSVNSGHYANISTASKFVVNFAKDSAPTTVMTLTSTASIVANVWTHICVQKKGLSVYLYINGVYDSMLALTEQPEPPALNKTHYIGCYFTPSDYFVGSIQEFIVTYSPTATFKQISHMGYQPSVIAEQPIIRCNFEGTDDSTVFVDDMGCTKISVNGSAVISTDDDKFGSSSAYFTGTSDYISFSPLSMFNYGGLNFGIEMWLKTTETAGAEQVVFSQIESASTRRILIKFGGVSENHKLMVNIGDPYSEWVITSLTKTDFSSAFRHLLVKKETYNFTVYVDGVGVGSSGINLNPAQTRLWDTTLLHFNGSDGSTTFTDNGSATRTWTASGNARIRTANGKFGGASGYFDGTNDYITTVSSSAFQFSTNDFTIEFWFNIQDNSQLGTDNLRRALIILGRSNLQLILNGSLSETGTGFILYDGTRAVNILVYTHPTVFEKNRWYHVAITRENSLILRLFIDGILVSKHYESGILGANASVVDIGGLGTGGGYARWFNGYLDELRITKGLCRYNKSFTLPTGPYIDSGDYSLFSEPSHVRLGGDGTNGFKGYIDGFQLYFGEKSNKILTVPSQSIPNNTFDVLDEAVDPLMHGNRGVILTNEIMGYSYNPVTSENRTVAYFNGASFIQFKKNVDEFIGSQNFTLEMWVYHLDSGVARTLFTSRTNSYHTYLLERATDGTVGFYISNANANGWLSTFTPVQQINTWYHIAVVRFNDYIQLYENGFFVGTPISMGTNSLNFSVWSSSYFLLGSSDNVNFYNGYIKNFQFIRGHAKYLSNFSPTTNPLELFNVDFYNNCLLTFKPSIISHYKLGDSGTILNDSDNIWNLNQVNPENINYNQLPLVAYNNEKDNSIEFAGGYGTGPSENVANKQTLSFNFFIKTSSSTGTIAEKLGAYLIEISGGKIGVVINYSGGNQLVATSTVSINDNLVHQITIVISKKSVEIYIDGVLDVRSSFNFTDLIYKTSEVLFGGTNSTMLQMRCNDFTDDCKNNVLKYGTDETIINDSPFGTKSIYFNGLYHIEIPKIQIGRSNWHHQDYYSYYPSVIDFTIEFWLKTFQTGLYSPIISIGAPGYAQQAPLAANRFGVAISITTNNVIRIEGGNYFDSYASTYFFYTKQGSQPITLGAWTHIAVTCKDHNIKLYQNGIEQTLEFTNFATFPFDSLINCIVQSPYNMNIGGWNWMNGSIVGSYGWRANKIALDDIRITRGVVYG